MTTLKKIYGVATKTKDTIITRLLLICVYKKVVF